MELKLTSVARASLEELRLDYEDFLRQRGLPVWDRKDPRRGGLIARRCGTAEEVSKWVGEVHDGGGRVKNGLDGLNGRGGQSGRHGQEKTAASSMSSIESIPSTSSNPATSPPTYPEIAANAAITLIAVASSLLDRQIATLARNFETEGGFTERLHRVRTARRKQGHD